MLKNKIQTLYKEYVVLKETVEEKTKQTKNIEEITDLDEIAKVATNRYVDLYLISKDSQIVFSDLICLIEFFKESKPDEKLPKEIEDFFDKERDWKPRRISIPLSDRIEIPEDLLNEEREKFLKSQMFINIKNQIESSLN